MLKNERTFFAEYEVRRIDLPPAGDVDCVFAESGSGTQATAVLVEPWSGPSWVGSFAAADPDLRRAVSGVFATPSSVRLCVVERGTAFLVDVLKPADYVVVPTEGPVVGVESLVEEDRLILVTPWSVAGVDDRGFAWNSRRIAIESIRIDEAEGGWLRGVADSDDDEPRDFAIDLGTGDVVGGVDVF